MKIKDVLEGIRMGSRDLAKVPADRYTLGFEFEISLADDYEYDDDWVDVQQDDFEEFADRWYGGASTFDRLRFLESNLSTSDRQEFLSSVLDPIPSDHIKELAKQDVQQQTKASIDRYGRQTFKNIHGLLDKIIDDHSEQYKNNLKTFMNETDLAVELLFYYDKNRDSSSTFTREDIKKIIQLQNDSDKFDLLDSAVSYLEREFYPRSRLNPDDTYFETIDGDLVPIDEIETLSDLLDKFDIDEDYLFEFYENILADADQEEMMDAYASQQSRTRSMPIKYTASRVSDLLGVEVEFKADTAKWAVVPDSTAGVDAEIVSPKMSFSEGIQNLKRILGLIRSDPNMYTGKPTGLHINIGTFEHEDIQEVDWLKFIIVAQADRVLDYFERSSNHMAISKIPQIAQSLESNNLVAYEKHKKDINDSVRNISSKFSAINLSKLHTTGAIEFRAPGNQGYEDQEQYLINTILRIIRAIEIARDPAAYKQEYLKKLYSMVATHNPAAVMGGFQKFIAELPGVDTRGIHSVPEISTEEGTKQLINILLIFLAQRNQEVYPYIEKQFTSSVKQDLVNKVKSIATRDATRMYYNNTIKKLAKTKPDILNLTVIKVLLQLLSRYEVTQHET